MKNDNEIQKFSGRILEENITTIFFKNSRWKSTSKTQSNVNDHAQTRMARTLEIIQSNFWTYWLG